MTRAEDAVRKAADALADAETQLQQEYLRLVMTGTPTWQAQKMAEVEFGRAVHKARAEWEIAVHRLQTEYR